MITSVYDACRRLADRDGLVADDAVRIAAVARGKVNDRQVASALRVLGRAGAVAVADASRVMAQVRLLASPERIRAEFDPAADGLALELLRSLWRRAGGRFHLGIIADLEAVPPGLGGARGAAQLLETLQARQFVIWRRVGEGLTVLEPDRSLDAWEVDWTTHERRRAGELRKLDQMQRYAYTESCRRGFVLRYFGDPAARPRCTACDNCTGERRSASEAPTKRGGRGAGRAKKATRRRPR